jgi:DNA-binding CsgD family transcriptional regulator
MTLGTDASLEPTAQALFGRGCELALLDDLVRGTRERGAALVVRGDAGIGKSAVIAEAGRRARRRGMTVLGTAGVQSEAHLAFACLHQLLRPLLGEIESLPAPQRAAVSAAFGITDAAEPDIFLVSLATLDLLSEAAACSPLVLVVEDAHWLDAPTCEVLAFVARRVEPEPVVLLFGVRDDLDSRYDDAGIPELRLGPLDNAAAAALLDAQVPGLPPDVRRRLLETSGGNPLALVELPRALESEQLHGGPLPDPLPLTARLERVFSARIAGLPQETRTLLLVAALDHDGAPADLLRAAGAVCGQAALPLAALTPALSARLVDLDEAGLRFRHPLIRSAIHQAANVPERRAAHAALAATQADDPDRSVWHLAAAADGADEEVAGALEAAAGRAERRAASAVALTALERAAALSEDPRRRGSRLIGAADIAFELGRGGLGLRLLRQAQPLDLTRADRIRLAWLLEVFGGVVWSGARRVASFVEIAEQMRAEGHPDRALSSLTAVALRAWWGNPDPELRRAVVTTAERIAVADDRPELLAILGLVAPIERGAVVMARLSRHAGSSGLDPRGAYFCAVAANAVGAFGLAEAFFPAAVAGLRDQDRIGLLTHARVFQAWGAIQLGKWNEAKLAAEEGRSLAVETSHVRFASAAQLAEAMVHALRGRHELAESLARDAERVLLPMGAHPMLALVQLVRGSAALAAGRAEDAYESLRRIFDPADIAYQPHIRGWALVDFVEAAAHTGHVKEARAVLAELEAPAVQSRSPLLLAGMRYARPLLAGDEQAEPLFRAAASADLANWPFTRARLLLAYGAWLRRRRRVAESRAPLRASREAFDALGARPWGERARQELRASGQTSRRRTPEARDALTPQELQIAQLAAKGLTNREIGQTLYLSHRTVGSHLYRIFPKLGISSRNELRSVLRVASVVRPKRSQGVRA